MTQLCTVFLFCKETFSKTKPVRNFMNFNHTERNKSCFDLNTALSRVIVFKNFSFVRCKNIFPLVTKKKFPVASSASASDLNVCFHLAAR